MINDQKYREIAQKVIECQNLDIPCVLIYLEKKTEFVEEVHWLSATNSGHETFGMMSRANTANNAKPVYLSAEDRGDDD